MRSYLLKPKEMSAVLALEPQGRYAHFVKRVADWGQVWGLKSEAGWVTAGSVETDPCLPVWPHKKYAELCCSGYWANTHPEPIEIHVFIERWLPGMTKDNIPVAVFPTAAMNGVVVSPVVLLESLKAELESIE